MDTKKVYAFTKENLKKAIRKIQVRIKENIPVEKCEICNAITERSKDLDTVLRIAARPNAIKQCPICGRVYLYTYSYEYLVAGASEEDERVLDCRR
mgnify:FL=1